MEHAHVFLKTVPAESSLHEEMQQHAEIIDPFARKDEWAAFGAFFEKKFSLRLSVDWERETIGMQLLPFVEAMSEDLRPQLDGTNSAVLLRAPRIGLSLAKVVPNGDGKTSKCGPMRNLIQEQW